jgi:hypothetical protein
MTRLISRLGVSNIRTVPKYAVVFFCQSKGDGLGRETPPPRNQISLLGRRATECSDDAVYNVFDGGSEVRERSDNCQPNQTAGNRILDRGQTFFVTQEVTSFVDK